MLVDTHCHLNFHSFTIDLDDVLERARIAGIIRMVVPAIDVPTSVEVIELSRKIPEIYPAVGIHPNESITFSMNDLDRLHTMIMEEKVVAIGEIGLDAYHQDVDMKHQIIAFEAQLDLADELELPVIIHNREADKMILEVLQRWLIRKKTPIINENVTGIMHSFSSPLDFAKEVIEMGFYVGASGPVTFKNTRDRREVFGHIPREKVVLETDAPFLTPHPFRGKRNEPSYLQYIAEEFARIWQLPVEEVKEITTRNAARIFKWNDLIHQN